jgi:hypothetical protein
MVAYCQEVCRLKDKFDGLELNHILRRLNEAADTLAKMALSRQPVPSGIFASDQYKPSIPFEEPEKAEDEPPASDTGAANRRPFPTTRSWSSTWNQ